MELARRRHVFIEIVDGAKIAQVPIEASAAREHLPGYGGHHNVAAIA